MIRIKLTPYRPELGTIYHRQTQGHSLMSADGNCQFFIDEDIADPDFWVIQGKGVREEKTCHVAPENTIFLATEPKSVLRYPKSYLRQFGHVCICQDDVRIDNGFTKVHYTPAILPWFIGYREDAEGNAIATMDFDDFLRSDTASHAGKASLSVISSNKAFTQGHIDRIRFVEKLKAHYGDRLDVFGRGFNPFDDKYDVLAPYKYHIVIENSSEPYYWTEKLGDCYLAGTFPFYYGCTNVADYFPRQAFEPIDIRKPDEAIRIIDSQIEADRYSRSVEVLKQCKDMMLGKYNMFEFIASMCESLDSGLPKKDVTIRPCRSSNDIRNLWNYTIGRNYYNLKSRIYGKL